MSSNIDQYALEIAMVVKIPLEMSKDLPLVRAMIESSPMMNDHQMIR